MECGCDAPDDLPAHEARQDEHRGVLEEIVWREPAGDEEHHDDDDAADGRAPGSPGGGPDVLLCRLERRVRRWAERARGRG